MGLKRRETVWSLSDLSDWNLEENCFFVREEQKQHANGVPAIQLISLLMNKGSRWVAKHEEITAENI